MGIVHVLAIGALLIFALGEILDNRKLRAENAKLRSQILSPMVPESFVEVGKIKMRVNFIVGVQ